ncbi:hypothetical protein MnTg04_00261 [bacterium MnTg04]|nr:hypothetical protein MnTg04_00261 [bacterium MnTg04]
MTGKPEAAAFRGRFESPNPQCQGAQFDSGQPEQRFAWCRQEAEAIDHFDLEFPQGLLAIRVGDTFVKDQPQVHVGQVIFRDQRGHAQFGIDTRIGIAVR